MDDRITLYGSFTSSSTYKPMLFLALAHVPFSFRTVNLKYGAQKLPDYLAVNRYGQVPTLRHRGLTIVQSNVILDYLARDHRAVRGRERAGPLAGTRVAVVGGGRDHQHRQGAPLQPLPHRRSCGDGVFPSARGGRSELYGRSARGREWLVGETCTIADIGCWGRMVFMAEGGFDIANWPNLLAWSERLRAMPGFALPYDLIPKKDQEMLPG